MSDAFGSPQAIAARFLGRYLLAFEGTSVLLLIAAVGGVVLATAPGGAARRRTSRARSRSCGRSACARCSRR